MSHLVLLDRLTIGGVFHERGVIAMSPEVPYIIHAKAGDSEAIEHLVKKAYRFTMRLLLRKYYPAITKEDAEDAFQKAVLQFLENPVSVKAKTDEQFYKWLSITSNNKVLDLLKSADYKQKASIIFLDSEGIEVELEFEAPDNVEETVINNGMMNCIGSDLDRLPDIDKAIIKAYIAGYSLKEIADKLELSYDNVRQRKRRAIMRLRNGTLKDME